MSAFIKLQHIHSVYKISVSVDHIISYTAESTGTLLSLSDDYIHVMETVDEIDDLLYTSSNYVWSP